MFGALSDFFSTKALPMKATRISLNAPDVEREELPADIRIVGAGTAGLSCAIPL